MAQAAGLLAKGSMTEDTTNKVTYLMAIDNARFRRPVVPGDRTQLHQLVANLVGNAIKYRSSRPLVVRISSIERADRVTISVAAPPSVSIQ
jgi:3-hydroxymyristoyl/3-hydroxydecanoyl-(acyl carrier protein) dehydratase